MQLLKVSNQFHSPTRYRHIHNKLIKINDKTKNSKKFGKQILCLAGRPLHVASHILQVLKQKRCYRQQRWNLSQSAVVISREGRQVEVCEEYWTGQAWSVVQGQQRRQHHKMNRTKCLHNIPHMHFRIPSVAHTGPSQKSLMCSSVAIKFTTSKSEQQRLQTPLRAIHR